MPRRRYADGLATKEDRNIDLSALNRGGSDDAAALDDLDLGHAEPLIQDDAPFGGTLHRDASVEHAVDFGAAAAMGDLNLRGAVPTRAVPEPVAGDGGLFGGPDSRGDIDFAELFRTDSAPPDAPPNRPQFLTGRNQSRT